MYTYLIKKNGYPIAQAKGKSKAVELLNKILDQDCVEGKWNKRFGDIIVKTDEYIYTIERA